MCLVRWWRYSPCSKKALGSVGRRWDGRDDTHKLSSNPTSNQVQLDQSANGKEVITKVGRMMELRPSLEGFLEEVSAEEMVW